MQEDKEMSMREIKIGDKVFQSIDPENTVNFECAIECTVIALRVDRYAAEDDIVVEKIKECEVSYGTFDEDSYVSAERLFFTEKEAVDHVRSKLIEKVEKLERRIKRHREIIGNIHETPGQLDAKQ